MPSSVSCSLKTMLPGADFFQGTNMNTSRSFQRLIRSAVVLQEPQSSFAVDLMRLSGLQPSAIDMRLHLFGFQSYNRIA